MKKNRILLKCVMISAITGAMAVWSSIELPVARAELVPPPPPAPIPQPLSEITLPKPDLNGVVRNLDALKVLGKALFWDQQLGSDNQACASCHFHSGADSRAKNQLNPGVLRVNDPTRAADEDTLFGAQDNFVYDYLDGIDTGLTLSGGLAGMNYELVPGDFPFHVLSDPDDRNSMVTFDMNDVASSQGTFDGVFSSIVPRDPEDLCSNSNFFRKVEPRNTPTTISAVFNHRNFWDGRANNLFNGVDPLGLRSTNARVVLFDRYAPNYTRLQDFIVEKPAAAKNSSLASQAVGPPLSDFEMSCAGRTFADLGRKMLSLQPLALQEVDATDSVLASYRHASGKGLSQTYSRLIRAAFHPDYWRARGKFIKYEDGSGYPQLAADPNGYTQMEHNFSLYFGIAVQAYESTLVPDQTPFDVFRAANPTLLNDGEGTIAGATVSTVDGFGPAELRGLDVFMNKGKCINCHTGAEFTGASVRLRANQPDGNEEAIERMPMAIDNALYDGGFYNIGVRPTFEDLGVGADLEGFPLSFARQTVTGNVIDDFNVDPNKFEIPGSIVPGERVAVDGAFKVPTVRNAELTGPYFHNGGDSTLAAVVEFYDRGGNRKDINCNDPDPTVKDGDTSGFGDAGDLSECSNLDPDIVSLGLSAQESADLVAFMIALTDPRVKYESYPFDHPQLTVSNGHTILGEDIPLVIPAVGATGRVAPISTFLNLDPFGLNGELLP